MKLKRPYLTMKEMDRLITLSRSPRDRLILRLLSRTGIRVGELLALRVEDIDFEKRTLLIEAEKSKKEKIGCRAPTTGTVREISLLVMLIVKNKIAIILIKPASSPRKTILMAGRLVPKGIKNKQKRRPIVPT